jgi:hypothetical protein
VDLPAARGEPGHHLGTDQARATCDQQSLHP